MADDAWLRVARDDAHLRMLRALDLSSTGIVPLTAEGRVLGAMSFARTASSLRYDNSDVATAEQVAGNAVAALANRRVSGPACASAAIVRPPAPRGECASHADGPSNAAADGEERRD
jgi:hypothetical protein